MKLEQTFEVNAPLPRVWEALIDVEYVAPCLPGAAITGRDDDGAYRGTFSVKLGPTTAAYNGVLRIDDVDESAHRATLHARGTDKRGQGGANATIVNTLTDVGGGTTRVEAVTDFTITGRLARFGRGGMIQDISNRLLRDFADCLQAKLVADGQPAGAAAESAGGGAEPAGVGSPSATGGAGASPATGGAGASPAAGGAGASPATGGAGASPAAGGAVGSSAPASAGHAAEAGGSSAAAGGHGPVTDAGAVPPDTHAPGAESDGPVPVSPPPIDRPVPPEVGAPPSRGEQESPAPMTPGARSSGPGSRGGPAPAKPVSGFSLLVSVLWERIRKFVAARRKAH